MTTPNTQLTDAQRAELARLVKELQDLDKNSRREDCGVYVETLAFALTEQMGRKQLYYGLITAGLPESSASEISMLLDHADLAWDCVAELITVSRAIRDARARERGEPPADREEQKLRGAADRLLAQFPPHEAWTVDCGDAWDLEFTPKQPNSPI